MPSPRPCLLFDLDGTLVDTDPLHLEAFNQLLGAFGKAISPEEYEARVMGLSNSIIMARLLPEVHVSEHPALADRKEELFREMAHALEPLEGLVSLLDWAHERGCPVGVVTNAPRANAETVLGAIGLWDRFDTVVIADELDAQKPHPLPYLTGLERLGSSPDRAVAFEDSRSGISAARAAGIPVVGLTTSLDEAALREAGAILAISHFSDPRLRDVVVASTGLA